MAAHPVPADPEGDLPAMFMLYGATMHAVQGVENQIGWLHVVVNTKPGTTSNASPQRQWKAAFERLWTGIQRGSSGMRLNDAVTGLKNHLPPELYAELQRFISNRRNQLAHRFLIERVESTDDGGARFASGSALELMQTAIEARRLIGLLQQQADAVRATWPPHEPPPADVAAFMETVARITMRKQFPPEMAEQIQADLRAVSRSREPKSDRASP